MARKSYLTSVDELNRLMSREFDATSTMTVEEQTAKLVELLTQKLIKGYSDGDGYVYYEIFHELSNVEPDADKMTASINQVINGETFKDRVRTHVAEKDKAKFLALCETELHRNWNQGSADRAADIQEKTGMAVVGTWVTAGDDRVRDTHFYLEGVSVDVGSKFYTYDGDSAYFPGDFSLASNNCGCRCTVSYRFK